MLTEESQGSNSGTAITHDSDPRPLRFEMYDRDTGVTTDVGIGPVPLNWAANPTPIPPLPPPAYNPLLLSQLTGGSQAGVPGSAPAINNLTAGATTVTLTCTDATTLSHTLTNAEVQALVIAQGQINQTTGTLDLSTVFPIDSLVGKTIDSVTATIATPYTCSMPCNFATSTYSFQGLLEGFNGTLVDTTLSGGPFANGPGLGILVSPQSFISLVYNIVGTPGTPAETNAMVVWLDAPTPTLDDLTLGGFEATISATSVPTLGELYTTTNADIHFIIHFSDSSVLSHTMTVAEFHSLVVAQGQAGNNSGAIHLSSVFDLTPAFGKTITAVTSDVNNHWLCTVPWNDTSTWRFYLHDDNYTLLNGTFVAADSRSNSPIAHVVGSGETLILFVNALIGAPVVVNLMTSLSTYRVAAENIGAGVYRASATAMGWDLGALVGANITDVLTTINPAFTGDGKAILTASMTGLYYLPDLAPAINTDLTNTTPLDTPVSPPEAFTSADDWWLYLMLAKPPYTPVAFNFDAATIQSLASAQALASDAWSDAPGHGDINWPSSLLAPYVGWSVIYVTPQVVPDGGLPIDYGPGPFDPTNVLAFSFNGIEVNMGTPMTYTTPNGVNLLLYPASGLVSSEAFMTMQGSPISWRISTSNASPAINLPLLFTEPYELRSRNLPAFYFDITGPSVHSETPTYNMAMFVSQDGIHWTACATDVTWGDYTGLVNFTGGWAPMQCKVYEIPNYGGQMVTVNKEYTGPWNYIKFMLFADAPTGNPPTRHEQDLQDIYLQIIANAREL